MLNLISDPWIPVRRHSGADTIRPDQIADSDVEAFAWPRPDLNLACYELLIGLTYLACPPEDPEQRYAPPSQAEFRSALEPLAPAFNLLGEGPLFLQDLEPLEGDPNPPDTLFLDSAGGNTAKKNADLMVRRDRYPALTLPMAAMALYALQAFAPSGGAGNHTSMRGGGPMVTLVRPKGSGLWQTIWANVPYGMSLPPEELNALPWMRPAVTSEKGRFVVPDPEREADEGPEPEMFFGQPRRLRLVAERGAVVGVIQRPHGTNYAQWVHDLTPYYEDPNGQILPVHPKPGPFGYRNWCGVILQKDKHSRPACLRHHLGRGQPLLELIVAGWAMKPGQAKPLDFIWSEQPVFQLSPEAEASAVAMVEAAEESSNVLAASIRKGMGKTKMAAGAADAARLAFFLRTETVFLAHLEAVANGAALNPRGWLAEMREVALQLFDERVLPGLVERRVARRANAVEARELLVDAFSGYGGLSKKIFQSLGLERPPQSRKPTTEEAEGRDGMSGDSLSVGEICYRWWRTAIAADTGRARKTRAELRRADTPLAILGVSAVHDLYRSLAEAGYDLRRQEEGPDRLALLAVTLANLNEGKGAVAARRFGVGKSPPLSAIRFETIIRTEAPRDLIRPIVRALAIIDGRADLRALAQDLFCWDEETRASWCFDYHSASGARPFLEDEETSA